MNAVVKTEIQAFQQSYSKMAGQVAMSLPSHIPPERFQRATMVAVQRNPDLLTKADRRSLFLSLQRAAADGLLPDGREGAIVMFGNQAQWMPMVAGLMKLARNSGEIASITAEVAYKGENFRVVLGDDQRIEHERNLELADGADVIAVYAIARLKGGEMVREVMTKAEIDKVRKVSRSSGSGPWATWYTEMAKKSVIRRLSKRLPLSTDRDGDARLQQAVERVDEAVEGSFTEAARIEELPPSKQMSKLDALEFTGNGADEDTEAETVEMAEETAP